MKASMLRDPRQADAVSVRQRSQVSGVYMPSHTSSVAEEVSMRAMISLELLSTASPSAADVLQRHLKQSETEKTKRRLHHARSPPNQVKNATVYCRNLCAQRETSDAVLALIPWLL